MAEGTEPCSSGDGPGDSSGDGRGDSAEHRDHPVSHPGATPSCAQERECWECWDAAGAGSMPLGGTWPWPLCSQRSRLLGLWPGVPVLEGTVSASRLAVPGGIFPWEGGARCYSLLGAPMSPPGGWGPDQPRDEGPLWLKPHGAGTGLGQRPCRCHLVSAGSPLHRSQPLRALPLQPSHPRVPPLCSACAQPWGQLLSLSLSQPHCPCPYPSPTAPVPVPIPAPLPLSLSLSQPHRPSLLLPQCRGWLSVPNWLLQPPLPPHWCELGVLRGGTPEGTVGSPWPHCRPGPPSTPKLTPPAPPAPPPVSFLKSSVLFQCRALCTVPRSSVPSWLCRCNTEVL
ncbi:vegetative cell wall protein gp1-like [Passer montanus]|uniref:vegetative cell wall protein gp1-like n=1 Tax=Passer montanus TaxID=9160 RepID=UPI0019618B2B|nr:vegetative cell wall protein gp1-like [Passer montanus]